MPGQRVDGAVGQIHGLRVWLTRLDVLLWRASGEVRTVPYISYPGTPRVVLIRFRRRLFWSANGAPFRGLNRRWASDAHHGAGSAVVAGWMRSWWADQPIDSSHVRP